MKDIMPQKENDNRLRQKLDAMQEAPAGMQADYETTWKNLEAKLEKKHSGTRHLWKYIAAIFLIAACIFMFYSKDKSYTANTIVQTKDSTSIISKTEQPLPVIINTPAHQEIEKQTKLLATTPVKQTAAMVEHDNAVDTSLAPNIAQVEKPVEEPLIENNIAAEKKVKRLRVVHLNEMYSEKEIKVKEEYIQLSQVKEKADQTRNLLLFWNWKNKKLPENTPNN